MSDLSGSASPEASGESVHSSSPSMRGSVLLGVAMGVGNALSYLLVLVLTRALGTEAFGAYSALSTVGIVLAIPAGAFQVVVARRYRDPASRTTGLAAAMGTGLVLTFLTLAAAPLLSDLLHLDAALPAVAMSLTLLPMTLTGTFQGLLLGSGNLTSLSVLYVVTAGTRLLAACLCALAGAGITQVFLAMTGASLLALGAGWWLCRDLLRGGRHHRSSLLAEMARSNATLAAFTALTNVDVLLVRHFLDPHTSGGYGLASTFARAMCWGTQFVALLVVPHLSGGSKHVLWRAAGLICLIGAAATFVASLDAERLVRLVGGAEFAGFGTLVVACLGLGTMWALAQLWLFSEMAGNTSRLGALAWIMVLAQGLLGWFWLHDSAVQIIALSAACTSVVVAAGVWRTRRQDATRLEEESVLLVADRP